jgi:hypothetical protein
VYARHLNVLVYLPRERYSASVASALAKALQASSGASMSARKRWWPTARWPAST